MKIGWPLALNTAVLTLLTAAAPMAAAQTGRAWIDPPAEGSAASPPSPRPQASASPPPQAASPAPPATIPPVQSAQPQTPIIRPDPAPSRQAEQPAPPPSAMPPAVTAQPKREPEDDKRTARTSVAKRFATDYLNSWSAPNDAALEATAAFYAPRVLFHGREVSLKRLFDEKRRFVKRWPEREYRPREDGVGTVCNPAGEICTVHAVFDFTASHPRRRRVSQGTGALQLVVQFIGDRPVIVAEHSTLLGQERKRNLAEGASHD